MKKHNFSAGPAILPQSVKEKASQAAVDYNNSGLSLMEMSHRGKEFVEILNKAEKNVRTLLGVDDNYAVLFLTGGASTQFFMTAMNLANPNDNIAYVDTGAWSSKAIKEAKLFSNVNVIASSKEANYNYIPEIVPPSMTPKYMHLTSNNTIYGTQIKEWPDVTCPFVCDMSSDIFSRPLPLEKFGVIYAGAQKNVGPAGVSLVIIKKELLGKVERQLPTILNYQTHIDKGSSFNTPPVFPIYVTMLTLQWTIDNGGVSAMAKRNSEKSQLLYNEIDSNDLFVGTAQVSSRSNMNATFLLKDESLTDAFLEDCQAAGIVGIKGHRSVGGFRASMYNAMGLDSVQALVDVMNSFSKKHG
ncbi:MAG: 3-phosphoserine/phosphohydroxythreonine transaminase [Saprospiraceae bacterium]|nr:3-phosphoserine/phosphohydroxythreonine transaminase [Bacteroidia bacterium]NNE14195.1 3-phosphoserine/phosphohydroxythreonine transaminase [Saprospiraceae bacterium]NNL93442.1 3-phosphoserine/phosphohydroxythreonine transaminase [Saprospiraceae bacterium]